MTIPIYWLLAMMAAGCCIFQLSCKELVGPDLDGCPLSETQCVYSGYEVHCDCAKLGRRP